MLPIKHSEYGIIAAMDVSSILLTGDDGYNSLGTRLLAHFFKRDFDIRIAGTKYQQSGVGGKISPKILHSGVEWETTRVDEVDALVVDGTPVDTIECARAYYKRSFDLVLSGVNWGANVSASLLTSGTVAAAVRSIRVGLTKKAIAISWVTPDDDNQWRKDNDDREDVSRYLQYPGEAVFNVVKHAMQHDMWGADFLNINLPSEPSRRVRFTRPLPDIRKYYNYDDHLDSDRQTFRFAGGLSKNLETDVHYDSGATIGGFISITPCSVDMLDESRYLQLEAEEFQL